MATRYVVNTSNIAVYTKALDTTTKNQVGVLSKGSTFYAEDYGASEPNWKRITKCDSKSSYVGKYVICVPTASGYTFSDSDGNVSGLSTLATTSDTNTPTSRDEYGDEVDEDDGVLGTYIEDTFMKQYSQNMTSEKYMQQLKDGIEVKHIRGILGVPHQFLPIADVRTTVGGELVTTNLGRVYSEKILKAMPLLLITPGVPSFMSAYSRSQRRNIIENWLLGATEALQQQLTNTHSGKYYSLKYAYVDYFKYVNAMLRSAAVFLNIHLERVNGIQLRNFHWLYDTSSNDENMWGKSWIGKFLGPYTGCVAFYADCGNTVSDSFSNSTMQSQLSSTLNSLSDTGRELNFLVGNVGSLAGLKVTALTGEEDLQSNMDNVADAVNAVLGKGNIFSSILNKAQTILAGGRLVFPEIWSDSSFGRSYSCSMRLISPSGDPLSVYLNILVPIYHLLGMCLPRQSVQQAYFSPFLLRCYYKGLFNIDMGIMTGLSITKGAECEWSVNGIPTVADISFEIKDLYEGMFMSRAEDPMDMNILSNITELDYIANSCGININDQEVMRTFRLFKVLKIDNIIGDTIANGIVGNICQYFNQQMNNLFGVFK